MKKKVGTKKQTKLWFKAKTHGFGWGLPQVWQGWVALLGCLVVGLAPLVYISSVYEGDVYCRDVISKGIQTDCNPEVATGMYLLGAIAWLIGNIMLLYVICELKGEKPQWRWGGKKKEHHANKSTLNS